MILFRFIALMYLKYIAIILGSLVLFFVGFDYLGNANSLPDSANLVLIYLLFKSFYAVDMLLPLSMIFAMITTKIILIRSNALVAFYALGYSKTDVLAPFITIALVIITLFIALHSTAFARSDEYSNNIRNYSQFLHASENLFFTYEDKYIYFGELLPLQKKAVDVRIFIMKDGSLRKMISAKQAQYRDDYWLIDDAKELITPTQMKKNAGGITVKEVKALKILSGFRPKILDQVYEGKVNFTIIDAIEALMLLSNQNVSVERILSSLYKTFVYPFFVPSLIVIMFFMVPISPRFLNVTLYGFGALLMTLMLWGVLFTLIELSNNKTVRPGLGIIAPQVLLLLIALWQFRRHIKHEQL